MEFSEEQIKVIAFSIRTLDKIQPEYDKSFEVYDSAKVKSGFAVFISGMLFLGVISGNYEIKESIGSLGVGSLPIVFIGAIIYFHSSRKKHDQIITKYIEAIQPLFDLGLSYTPKSKDCSNRRLIILKTGEELNINDFENSM